jgi:cell division septation protein DedD
VGVGVGVWVCDGACVWRCVGQVTASAAESGAIWTVSIAPAGLAGPPSHRRDLNLTSSAETSGRQSPATVSPRSSATGRGNSAEPTMSAGRKEPLDKPPCQPAAPETGTSFWIWCGAALAVATLALWLWRRKQA